MAEGAQARTRSQVAIVGAGPAGMLLGHLLRQHGIEVVILERRSRAYVEARVRAGVLEPGTVALLGRLGLDRRLKREGLVHHGTKITIEGEVLRIDFAALVGASTTVYGQQEVMRDLFDAAVPRGLDLRFGVEDLTLEGLDTERPRLSYRVDDAPQVVECEVVAGCDGFHGLCRTAIPPAALRLYERAYPFGWLGLLAEVPPADEELIYASHERGFALASMRSPTRSRYYLQCAADERLEDWPDERLWDELALRLGPEIASRITRGPSFEKGIAQLRSFVAEPMRYGRLFLAGDAAHIVPPTGAKGLNLAASDVELLGAALIDFFEEGSSAGIDTYSARALGRVWRAERFSWWFTGLTHRFPDTDAFTRKMQVAELDYIRGSRAAQTTLAENYVGLPLAWPASGV